jgi:hypothetical protein
MTVSMPYYLSAQLFPIPSDGRMQRVTITVNEPQAPRKSDSHHAFPPNGWFIGSGAEEGPVTTTKYYGRVIRYSQTTSMWSMAA